MQKIPFISRGSSMWDGVTPWKWRAVLGFSVMSDGSSYHSDHCTYMETQSRTEAGSNASLNSSLSNWHTQKHFSPLSRCSCYSKCWEMVLMKCWLLVVTQWLYQSVSIRGKKYGSSPPCMASKRICMWLSSDRSSLRTAKSKMFLSELA